MFRTREDVVNFRPFISEISVKNAVSIMSVVRLNCLRANFGTVPEGSGIRVGQTEVLLPRDWDRVCHTDTTRSGYE